MKLTRRYDSYLISHRLREDVELVYIPVHHAIFEKEKPPDGELTLVLPLCVIHFFNRESRQLKFQLMTFFYVFTDLHL